MPQLNTIHSFVDFLSTGTTAFDELLLQVILVQSRILGEVQLILSNESYG
jgi:hypothetical protein